MRNTLFLNELQVLQLFQEALIRLWYWPNQLIAAVVLTEPAVVTTLCRITRQTPSHNWRQDWKMTKTQVSHMRSIVAVYVCFLQQSPWKSIAYADCFATLCEEIGPPMDATSRYGSRSSSCKNRNNMRHWVCNILLWMYTWCDNWVSLSEPHTVCSSVASLLSFLHVNSIIDLWLY